MIVMVPFCYPALQGNQIRLLTIEPSPRFDDAMIISLQHTSFDSSIPPKYEALSYVWGSEENKPLVGMDLRRKTTLPVTRNLDLALRHLRNAHSPRIMWIDAICIDQSNMIERGHQVALMGSIYEHATRVVAWLGPEENSSDIALSCMEWIGSKAKIVYGCAVLPADYQDEAERIAVGESGFRPFDSAQWESVRHLLLRPWFTRLWVHQEIYLAGEHSVVQCGTRVVLWSVFRTSLTVIVAGLGSMEVVNQALRHLGLGQVTQAGARKSHGILAMRNNSVAKCKDPRDRIFAIRQILMECHPWLDIIPDYSKPATEIYRDVIEQYLQHEADVQFLYMCELHTASPEPTWTPDWATTAKSEIGFVWWFPCASSSLKSPPAILDNGTLRVVGTSVDVITRLIKFNFGLSTRVEDVYQEARNMLPKIAKGQYAGGGSTVAAYARTLVADSVRESYLVGPSWAKSLSTLTESLEAPNWSPDDLSVPGSAFSYSKVRRVCSGRQFLTTRGGLMGLAPASAQLGDRVCVLVGCNQLMALRPNADGSHKVIGPCFMHSANQGESLLGPLPQHVRRVIEVDDSFLESDIRGVYLDVNTGEYTYEDPRLSSLPVDLADFRHKLKEEPTAKLDVSFDTLQSFNQNVRYFDLV